jgi:hypothetical protein
MAFDFANPLPICKLFSIQIEGPEKATSGVSESHLKFLDRT